MANTPPAPAPQSHPNEEPEIQQEEAVPSDGRDRKGEKMMEELGENKPGRPLSPDKGN